MSRPLQVYLDETDLKNLTRWARERKWTKSQAGHRIRGSRPSTASTSGVAHRGQNT